LEAGFSFKLVFKGGANMSFPQIRMEATLAKLAISTTRGELQITQPPADVTIEQPKPEMVMNVTPGRLTIDQSQAWADMDLKHIFRRIEEAEQEGYESWLAYLATTSQQGDELMKIENGGDVLASQAQINSEDPPLEFNVGFVPSPFSVKIHYEPAQLMIDWNINKPLIDIKARPPIIDYKPGKVSIDMAQHNSLRIDVVT
jgi:hypothetical protein